MNQTYIEINIFNKQNQNNIICIGRILLDNTDGWFEGIEQQEKRFIFGVFLRPKVIQLYSMDSKSNIDDFALTRSYNITYEGNASNNSQIQMLVKSLEGDPRDMDTEKEKFKTRLEEFKNAFLVGKNKEKYIKYYEQKENIFRRIMQEYEKNDMDFSR